MDYSETDYIDWRNTPAKDLITARIIELAHLDRDCGSTNRNIRTLLSLNLRVYESTFREEFPFKAHLIMH